jgi:hypothetical protein
MVPNQIDLTKFALDVDFQQPRQWPLRRRDRRFIRGPIPLDWILIASELSPSALKVALIICYIRGTSKVSSKITITRPALDRFSVSRRSAYRALDEMEKAELISVEKRKGRNSLITALF